MPYNGSFGRGVIINAIPNKPRVLAREHFLELATHLHASQYVWRSHGLNIINASTLLGRFSETLKTQDIGTLVPQMEHWRMESLDAIGLATSERPRQAA
jgi:hypothetical protein